MKKIVSFIIVITLITTTFCTLGLNVFAENSVRLGDVNSDGRINSIDVALVGRNICGLIDLNTYSTTAFQAADANRDTHITSTDFCYIQKYVIEYMGMTDFGEDIPDYMNPGVYLYSDTDFMGECIQLTADNPNIPDNFGVSSIIISGDYNLIAFGSDNYGGWSNTYRSTGRLTKWSYLGSNYDKTIASVKIISKYEEETPGVYLYDNSDYNGNFIKLTESTNFVGYEFNDKTSSIKIVGNYSINVFQHSNYSGWELPIYQNTPYLSGHYAENISSLKITQTSQPQKAGYLNIKIGEDDINYSLSSGNNTITVPVYSLNSKDYNINDFNFSLKYDSKIFEYVTYDFNNTIMPYYKYMFSPYSSPIRDGIFTISAVNTFPRDSIVFSNINTNGLLFNLKFKVKTTTPGSYSLNTISQDDIRFGSSFNDVNISPYYVNFICGKINITN